jgi:hypothetical protein
VDKPIIPSYPNLVGSVRRRASATDARLLKHCRRPREPTGLMAATEET